MNSTIISAMSKDNVSIRLPTMIPATFFFLSLVFLRGFLASELELRLLLFPVVESIWLLFLIENGPMLRDVLLDVDLSALLYESYLKILQILIYFSVNLKMACQMDREVALEHERKFTSEQTQVYPKKKTISIRHQLG